MKSYRRLGWFNARVITCLIALGIVLFTGETIQAAPQYTFTCVSCHQMPPLDSAGGIRDPNSSAVKGNHQTHAGLTGSTCVKCHGTEWTVTDHRDKIIQMSGNINSSPHPSTAKYSRVFFNQTSIPPVPLGTCSNVNCHFEKVTPEWGTVPSWSYAKAPNDGGNCSSCHDGASATALATGKHLAHITAFGGTTASCQKCHPNRDLAGAAAFSHATSANRVIDINFSAAPNSGSGTYTGGRNGTQVLPSAATSATGTCSALYCHSSGKKGQTGMATTDEPSAPIWSGAVLDCKGCHGKSTTAGSFTSVAGEPNYLSLGANVAGSNSHLKHVGSAGASTCVNCHSKTTATGAAIIAGGGQHLDTFINYTAGNGKTFGKTAATKTCSNISCHSGGSAQWGATLACNSCHGGPTALGAPILATRQHAGHINNSTTLGANFSCGECHANVVTVGNDITISNSANHANGLTNYSGAKAYKSGYTVGSYTTCATYCHSSGKKGQANMVATVEPTNPNWNGSAGTQPLDCKGCHGAQVTPTAGVAFNSIAGEPNYISGVAGSVNANSHQKHVGSVLVTAQTSCANCHSKTTTLDGLAVVTGGGQHIDRFVNYTSGNGKTFGKVAATKTCSNISCHSGGGIVVGVAAAQWGNTLGCNGCHGDASTLVSGAHTDHLAAGATCNSCHNATASSNTVIGTPANHLNSLITINFNTAAASNAGATYNSAIAGGSTVYQKAIGGTVGSCATTVCHGTTSPNWGSNSTSATCTKCHGKPTVLANYSTANAWQAAPGYAQVAGSGTYTNGVSATAPYGAHDAHLRAVNAYTGNRTTCDACHNGAVPATGSHANGTVTVAFNNLAKNSGTSGGSATTGPSARGLLTPVYTSGTGTCSAVYCHGGVMAAGTYNGTITVTAGGSDTTPTWTDTAYLTAYAKNTSNCGKCHAALPVVPAKDHSALVFATTNCNSCHGHEGNGTTHIDGILQASGDCNGCHSYDTVGSVWGTNRYATHGSWGSNLIVGAGAHAKHIDYIKARLYGAATTLDPTNQTYGTGVPKMICGTCHSNNEGVDHNQGLRNINFGSGTYQMGSGHANVQTLLYITGTNPTYNTVAKTCSNLSCHYFVAPAWQ